MAQKQYKVNQLFENKDLLVNGRVDIVSATAEVEASSILILAVPSPEQQGEGERKYTELMHIITDLIATIMCKFKNFVIMFKKEIRYVFGWQRFFVFFYLRPIIT